MYEREYRNHIIQVSKDEETRQWVFNTIPQFGSGVDIEGSRYSKQAAIAAAKKYIDDNRG